MASAVAPPTTAKTTTSVDPLYTQALEQAKAALAAEQAPVQAEQTASDAFYKQRGTDATDSAAALSELLKGIAPATQAVYTTAAQNQELAANGFSAGMQDALKGNADNLNAMLDKIGSPAQIDSHAAQSGDVLYGLGGYIPGQTFNREGAAFGAAAAALPGTALLKGQQTADQLKAAGAAEHSKFDAKLAEMAGNLPGDTQTNYDNLQKLALENKKFAEQVKKDNVDAAYKTATLKLDSKKFKLDAAKYKTSVDEFNVKQKLAVAKYNESVTEFNANYSIKVANAKLAAQRVGLEAQRIANTQYNANRDYAVKLANLGIAQKKMQMAITTNAFKAAHGGYTKQQLTKFEGQSLAMAQSSLHGSTSAVATYDKDGRLIPAQSKTKVTGGVKYFPALSAQLKKGIPLQVALAALDRVYPQNARPTPQALQDYLGPLTPAAVNAAVKYNDAVGAGAIAQAGSYGFVPGATHGGGRLAGAQLTQLAAQALRIAAPAYATPVNVQALIGRIMQESGGDPRAINNWDSNAKAGHPSKGILQTIDSTFTAHALPGHTDIWNPLDNAIAAIRYMLSTYGHIVGPSGSGY